MKFLKSTSGFTIIELMIAMTIFAVMSTMVITIYFSITGTTRKLNAQRELSESAREVIERITEDVREYGFSGSEAFDLAHTPWTTYDPLDGSEYLNLKNGTYVYGKKTLAGIDPCLVDDKNNPKTHCGLYFKSATSNPADYTDLYNLIDSFTPDDARKRVRVEDLKFYISGCRSDELGCGNPTAAKVTLNMTLALIPGYGVSEGLASTTKLHIQTTISTRSWKQQ